jgi:hypothetical protein
MPNRSISPEYLENGSFDKAAAYRVLVRDAATHCGIGTAHDIADYFRLRVPETRVILESLVASGEVDPVMVSGWGEVAYLDPAAVRPRAITGSVLLSPFDPIVWYRERAERLFGFRYRIEIYVPAPQRVYGYYVLPFMLDGALVARVDLKADRKAGRLLVRSAFIEEGHDAPLVTAALAEELDTFGRWLGMGDMVVDKTGDLGVRLAASM